MGRNPNGTELSLGVGLGALDTTTEYEGAIANKETGPVVAGEEPPFACAGAVNESGINPNQ